MQTLDKETVRASAPQKGMRARLSAIERWCDKRGIEQKYGFFRGCDPAIEAFEARIRLVTRTSRGDAATQWRQLVNDEDAPWIESMEATIEALNNRKAAA